VDAVFFLFSFYLTLSLHINTYKDHSLQLIVRRPYSGLTFPLSVSSTFTFTPSDCLVATGDTALGLGLDFCTASPSFRRF